MKSNGESLSRTSRKRENRTCRGRQTSAGKLTARRPPWPISRILFRFPCPRLCRRWNSCSTLNSTRGTGVIISCAQPDSYWFMTRPKAKLNFPLVIYASWLFSVFSRVWKPPSRIAYWRAARYLDLLVSSHWTMSFKCRVRVLEGKRFQSQDVTEWKNHWNELYE